jgi:spermidine dehydrogenase
MNKSDRQLGMDRAITRRDFLNGVSMAIGGAIATAALPGLGFGDEAAETFAQDRPGYYPPALTGMRGSTDGSYEAAHALRDGDFWKKAGAPKRVDDVYDLVVVGGGISGLAAAHFYRRENPTARILILDNHDDFGGHAKRNEFRSGGRLLLANGGTWAIESPFPYSKEAARLMAELGINPAELAQKCDVKDAYKNLQSAYFFDKETFGADKFVAGGPGRRNSDVGDLKAFAASTPLAENARRDFVRLNETTEDFFPGLSSDEKKDRLSRMSYKDYLLKVVKVDVGVVPVYQAQTQGLYGVGIDAVSALDCWVYRNPGFAGLKLDPGPHPRMGFTARGFATPKPDYEFHYPDGNASIARMLVRVLIPGSIGGKNAEDIVTAKADYSKLDQADSAVRIRLNSTVVHARNVGETAADAKEVEVSYAREGKVYSVRGKGVVMACWNTVIPFVCPELPQAQKDALLYGTKIPLVYTSVAIKNWKTFEKLSVHHVTCPGMYHTHVSLDNAVTIGDYKAPLSPEEPILVRMTRTPCAPGLPEREQHKVGRAELLVTPFSTFERKIRDQLGRVLGAGGFDPARDIDALTVNRWPHGYAYEYNPLFDPEWAPGQAPCEVGRAPFGRITIANADAAAAAYTDQAMDQAYRAVSELSRVPG